MRSRHDEVALSIVPNPLMHMLAPRGRGLKQDLDQLRADSVMNSHIVNRFDFAWQNMLEVTRAPGRSSAISPSQLQGLGEFLGELFVDRSVAPTNRVVLLNT